MGVYHDFADACLLESGKGLAVGTEAYLHEHTVQGEFVKLFGLAVLQLQCRYLFAVSFHFHCLCGCQDVHIRQTSCLVLKNLVGFQGVHKLDDRHFLTDARQVDGGFDARVSASHYGHFLSGIERPVAVRTECHSAADVFGFARHVQPAPSGSCGDDDCRCAEHFASLHGHLLFLAFQVGTLDASVLEQFNRIVREVRAEVVGQLVSCRIRYGNQILDAHGLLHLSADAFGQHRYLQPLAGGVDGRRCSGRTSTQHQQVKSPMDWGFFVFGSRTRRIDLFQFLQQFTERAASHVNQLSVGKDRWNGLHSFPVHFVLEECTVHHLVTDVRIQQGKDVERLHHIGAVGTGERHVSLQADVALEGTDAARDTFIGQVLSLSVGIEYGQQERSELVSVRNAPEGDACVFAVLQEGKGQGIAIGFVDFDLEMR